MDDFPDLAGGLGGGGGGGRGAPQMMRGGWAGRGGGSSGMVGVKVQVEPGLNPG